MHPIIGVCVLLVAAGAAMAVRWGHLAIDPPWVEDDVPVRERIRRLVWFAAVYTAAAIVSGLTVLGPGGRLVMRLLAVTAGDPAQGRVTEAEAIVGAITVEGTIGLVVFVGLFGGVLLAGLHGLLRKWLPPTRWGALTVAVLFGVLFATQTDPLRPENPDFDLVGPGWVSVVSFLALGALTMLTMAAVAGRLARSMPLLDARARSILPYLVLVPLVAAGTLVAPALLVAAVGLALLQWDGFRRVWANRRVLLAGRVAIAGLVLALAPGFVGDLASILG